MKKWWRWRHTETFPPNELWACAHGIVLFVPSIFMPNFNHPIIIIPFTKVSY